LGEPLAVTPASVRRVIAVLEAAQRSSTRGGAAGVLDGDGGGRAGGLFGDRLGRARRHVAGRAEGRTAGDALQRLRAARRRGEREDEGGRLRSGALACFPRRPPRPP